MYTVSLTELSILFKLSWNYKFMVVTRNKWRLQITIDLILILIAWLFASVFHNPTIYIQAVLSRGPWEQPLLDPVLYQEETWVLEKNEACCAW